MLFRAFLHILLSVLLTGCGTVEKPRAKLKPKVPVAASVTVIPEPVRVQQSLSSTVAVFLPLTGTYQGLGEELLKTIQLAYINSPHPTYHLAIYDTKGTPEGTLQAYQSLKQTPQLILGPVFSAEVKALLKTAPPLPVILTFSNDETIKHPRVFLLGLSPQDQIYAVVDYAKNQGYRTEEMVGIFPDNDYGKLLKEGLNTTEPHLSIFLYDKNDQYFRHISEKVQKIPARLLLIPEGQPVISQLLQGLAFADFNFDHVRILGSALWDKGGDTTTLNSIQDSQLLNAWFAAPDPNDRYLFEQQYKKFYGGFPSRFSVLGAACVEITNDIFAALQQDHSKKIDLLLRQISFNTVEGTYHFKDNGSSKRSLAILEIRPKGTYVVSSSIKNLVSQIKSNHTQPVPQIAS